jgi:hypothetical protein
MSRTAEYTDPVRQESIWEREELQRVREAARAAGEDVTQFLHCAARERMRRLRRRQQA